MYDDSLYTANQPKLAGPGTSCSGVATKAQIKTCSVRKADPTAFLARLIPSGVSSTFPQNILAHVQKKAASKAVASPGPILSNNVWLSRHAS